MYRSHSLPSLTGSLSHRARSQILVVVTALLAVPIAFVASLFPLPYVLPAFGILCLAVSVVTYAVAWLISSERTTEHVTLWDVASGFALIGIVAVLISRTDYPLPSLL